ARSSLSPGCSPTSITSGCAGPSPKTVWVAFFQRSHPWQSLDACWSPVRLSCSGTQGAAEGLGVRGGMLREEALPDFMSFPFSDRLRKTARRLGRWAERAGVTAWRVYDRDIPEYPFVVERYGPAVHLVEYPRRAQRAAGGHPEREAVFQAVVEVLEVEPERVFTKTHAPQPWGRPRYGKLANAGAEFEVQEGPLRFVVNLSDRLDTGLFLDHRNTRARVRAESAGKRMLNLFGYTGSFTVAAATGGARSTTTVDLSATYLDWAGRNLALNAVSGTGHALVRADVLRWIQEAR